MLTPDGLNTIVESMTVFNQIHVYSRSTINHLLIIGRHSTKCLVHEYVNWRPLGLKIAHLEQLAQIPSERLQLFLIYKPPRYFLSNFESICLWVQKKLNIDFQNGGRGGHLGFSILTILAIFYLQVAFILPTKFSVNWTFGSGEDVQNKLQHGDLDRHPGFLIETFPATFIYKSL